MTRFPKPLSTGDTIAITAPSSGVSGIALQRLDLALNILRRHGYRIIEGNCLRSEYKDASSNTTDRAAELNQFLLDPAVSAIIPPWGGELATELLEYIDFEHLKEISPKWLLGYSDISTLLLPLTLLSGWATAHGPNLMDLAPTQPDDLTGGVFSVLEAVWHKPIIQYSSNHYQAKHTPYEECVDAPFNLSHTTQWKLLNDNSERHIEFEGKLIGGCLDTIAWLAGTKFGDIPEFIERSGQAGVILYLENVEMEPCSLVRCLRSLYRQKWFEGLAGLLIGRNAGAEPTAEHRLGYIEALQMVLGELPYPVIVDVDIGHMPPQFTLVNGAHAVVNYQTGRGRISQNMPNTTISA